MNNDLISREALKKKFERLVDETIPYGRVAVNDMRELIDNAPSVEPLERIGSICDENCGYHRPQGKWIGINRDCRGYCDTFKCSICGAYIYPYTVVKELDYNGCPYCFADMRGGAE